MGQLSCLSDQDNLGKSSCKKLPQLIKGMITTPDDFEVPFATAETAAPWQAALLAAAGARIFYWPVAINIENLNEEAVYEETPLGVIAVRDGRYRWRLSFRENLEMHKAMYSHKNFAGRVFFIDDRNKIIGTTEDEVNFKGLSLDLLNPEKLTLNDGSVSSKTPVYVSLADNTELDQRGTLIAGGGFLGTLTRLTTAEITIEGTPIATEIVAKVVSKLDNEAVLGLVQADFVLLDGAQAAQTITGSVDNGDGTYTLSGSGLVSGTLDLVAAASLSVPGWESDGPATVTI